MTSVLRDELRRLSQDESSLTDNDAAASIVLVAEPAPSVSCKQLDRRLREVMHAVVELRLDPSWTGEEADARDRIPEWFIEGCSPRMSELELARWLSKWRQAEPAMQRKMERQKGWTFGDWLHWFSPGPDERQWAFVWSRCTSANRLQVGVSAANEGVATGALKWLLTVAGAASVHEQ